MWRGGDVETDSKEEREWEILDLYCRIMIILLIYERILEIFEALISEGLIAHKEQLKEMKYCKPTETAKKCNPERLTRFLVMKARELSCRSRLH